jgi:hypothetical protein
MIIFVIPSLLILIHITGQCVMQSLGHGVDSTCKLYIIMCHLTCVFVEENLFLPFFFFVLISHVFLETSFYHFIMAMLEKKNCINDYVLLVYNVVMCLYLTQCYSLQYFFCILLFETKTGVRFCKIVDEKILFFISSINRQEEDIDLEPPCLSELKGSLEPQEIKKHKSQ